jgi:hypothetical protein
MRTVATALTVALVLAAGPLTAAAQPFDGSTPMQCTIQTVMVCDDPTICVRGNAGTVNLPQVLRVDVAASVIGGAATGRTVRINSVRHGGGRLLLQGEEVTASSVGAWDMVVVEATGVMSGAVLSHGGGFLMFGTCSRN